MDATAARCASRCSRRSGCSAIGSAWRIDCLRRKRLVTSIAYGSERGPVALPVFKIGRCLLAGQAGFDSQALPPIAPWPIGGSAWESNPACPARRQRPILKTGRATGPRSLPQRSYQQTQATRFGIRQDPASTSSAPASRNCSTVNPPVATAIDLRAGDARAFDVVRRVADHDHALDRLDRECRRSRRGCARSAPAHCDPPHRR